MQGILSQLQNTQTYSKQGNIKLHNKYTEFLPNTNVKSVTNSYFLNYAEQISKNAGANFNAQSGIFDIASSNTPKNLAEILNGLDLKTIGYDIKSLNSLTKDEASELIGEDGFFGINKTSERIAGFIISGAADDIEKLKLGMQGMLRGFKEAQSVWGKELPEISQKTMQKSIQAIEKRISELGGNILNVTA